MVLMDIEPCSNHTVNELSCDICTMIRKDFYVKLADEMLKEESMGLTNYWYED